jgi:CRP/FNR family nitrogen fixation transcriptional regulator
MADMTPSGPARQLASAAAPVGLQPAGVVRHFVENQHIFAQGDDARGYFMVATGTVRTCCLLRGGRRHVAAFHVPGDFFGFEEGAQRSLSAEAVCRSSVVSYRSVIPKRDSPFDDVRTRLLDLAVRTLSRAQKHAVSLGRRNAEERIAAFLIDWAACSPHAAELSLPMTRQDLGDHLGLTVETVSRTLKRMARNGLIELRTARRIRLTDTAALNRLTS